ASDEIVQVTGVPAGAPALTGVHVAPAGGLGERRHVVPAGITSVSTTLAALLGPWLVAVIVYVISRPGTTVDPPAGSETVEAVLTTPRSAAGLPTGLETDFVLVAGVG